MRKVPDGGPKSALGGGRSGVVAEQIVEEIAGTAARGIGILRAATVLGERRQHRAALIFALGAAEPAAAQALEAGGDLVEIGAHLLNLVVDRAALGRRPLNSEKKPALRSPSAWPARSPGRVRPAAWPAILVAADLLFLGGIAGAGAAVNGGQLPFGA